MKFADPLVGKVARPNRVSTAARDNYVSSRPRIGFEQVGEFTGHKRRTNPVLVRVAEYEWLRKVLLRLDPWCSFGRWFSVGNEPKRDLRPISFGVSDKENEPILGMVKLKSNEDLLPVFFEGESVSIDHYYGLSVRGFRNQIIQALSICKQELADDRAEIINKFRLSRLLAICGRKYQQ